MTIKGGYILQPRILDQSPIMTTPPHVREIWLYLLRRANHSDNKELNIRRGQLFTSYKQIIDDLVWYVGYRKESYKKHHCEIAMKVLTKEHMITTAKTTRGMIVTICNYDYYQDPKNYENDTEKSNKTTRKRQSNDTIHKNDQEGKELKESKRERKALSISEREKIFKKEVYGYEKYDKIMLDKFFNHWSQTDKNGTKMNFEKQKTWDIGKRLANWNLNERPAHHSNGNGQVDSMKVKKEPEKKWI